MQNINLSFYIHIYAIDLNVQIDICIEWNRIQYTINNIIHHTTHNNKFNPWIVCTSPIALQLAKWKGSQLRHERKRSAQQVAPFVVERRARRSYQYKTTKQQEIILSNPSRGENRKVETIQREKWGVCMCDYDFTSWIELIDFDLNSRIGLNYWNDWINIFW